MSTERFLLSVEDLIGFQAGVIELEHLTTFKRRAILPWSGKDIMDALALKKIQKTLSDYNIALDDDVRDDIVCYTREVLDTHDCCLCIVDAVDAVIRLKAEDLRGREEVKKNGMD